MSPSDYRQHARRVLAGHWGTAILVGFVATILGGNGNPNVNLQITQNIGEIDPYSIPPQTYALLFTITSIIATAALVMSIVYFLLGGVIQLGSAKYHLNLIDGRDSSFSDLFSQFSRFGSALVMNLLQGIFVLLWMLLFIIPGFIAAYSYAMAPYIMLEDPNCGGYEALKRSKQLMKGHKMDLFLLDLSFIGWELLCVLSLGIGFLWLYPYVNTARASFYRDITQGQSQSQGNTTVEF